jgi:hypothetical protein
MDFDRTMRIFYSKKNILQLNLFFTASIFGMNKPITFQTFVIN